jgi:serine phosphatase RsbU (regulator of sigma subunit)
LLFSDGITDVFDESGEQLGPDGISQFAEETMRELARPVALENLTGRLVEKIQRFGGSAEFDDDFTLMALRRLETSGRPATPSANS